MSNKKPELSDLTKKFDFGNLVDSIKSLINPTAGTPEVDPSDAIGLKIAQLSVISQQLSKIAEEQTKEFNKLNSLLNGLYQDIERLRHPQDISSVETNVEIKEAEVTVKSAPVESTQKESVSNLSETQVPDDKKKP